MAPPRTRAVSGQAAVEAALTMPMMVFVLLGTLQMFMMMHARILTQLAAFQATRAASMNHGNCDRMIHAAILQLLPAIEPFARPTGSLSTNVASTFKRYMSNSYNGRVVSTGTAQSSKVAYVGTIVWIVRDLGGRTGFVGSSGDDDDFDQSQAPMRMETNLIFWFPMRIPFANWVIGRAMLAHYGLQNYTAQNPLLLSQKAKWLAGGGGAKLPGEIKAEMAGRMATGEYVFPIIASYTMRMMTPMKLGNTTLKNCLGTPPTL